MPEQNLYSTFNHIAKQARILSPTAQNNSALCKQMIAPMREAENAGLVTQDMSAKGIWLSSDFAKAGTDVKTLPQVVFQTAHLVMNQIRTQRERNTKPMNVEKHYGEPMPCASINA